MAPRGRPRADRRRLAQPNPGLPTLSRVGCRGSHETGYPLLRVSSLSQVVVSLEGKTQNASPSLVRCGGRGPSRLPGEEFFGSVCHLSSPFRSAPTTPQSFFKCSPSKVMGSNWQDSLSFWALCQKNGARAVDVNKPPLRAAPVSSALVALEFFLNSEVPPGTVLPRRRGKTQFQTC